MRFGETNPFKRPTKHVVDHGHRYFGEMCLAQAWGLAQQPQRSDAETQHMTHCAHAARFHWTMLGEPPHLARADHVLSHVCALRGDGETALAHAQSCMAFVETGGKGFTPQHEAWAHEALARAHSLLGNTDQRDHHLEAAQDAGIRIGEPSDLKLLFAALQTIEGCTLKYDVNT